MSGPVERAEGPELNTNEPLVVIRYCMRCRWLLRAGWVAQELLTTFAHELGGVTLAPGSVGQFDIFVDGALVWSRPRDGGFPELTALKQYVRDAVAPGRALAGG